MSNFWKKWALITVSAFLLFLLPETVSYAQNSTATDNSKEIIVMFKSRPTISLLSALSTGSTQNLEVKNGITASNGMVFTVPSGDIQTAMDELTKNPNVASVFPNYLLNLQVIPNDPLVSETPLVGFPRPQWNLFNLNLAGTGRSAWDVTTGSTSVVVAVIDTGIDSTHPDLAGKIDSLVDCSTGTCSVVTTMTDAHAAGHGTHVAGIVGAITNNNTGIASAGYNTKIMVIKVMDSSGNTETDNFFNAIKWAADHGAKVINTSFGVVAESLSAAAIAEYNSHVAYAWDRGAVVVAAAGNCFGNTNGREGCGIFANGGKTVTGYAVNSKLYPAASPNVLSVAASTVDNTIASYSERNDSANANTGNWISVAAPGGDGACTDSTKTCILSTVPGASLRYFWQSGTSMASPQVAGVAALVLAAKSSLTNEQVKNIIETSANHSVLSGVTKFGLVNALAAVEAANGTINTTPTPTPNGTSNLTPTLTIAPTSAVTVSGTPTIVPTTGPTATPTVTPYPTIPPRLPKTLPNPYPQAPFCAVAASCTQKAKGDANCDGKVDETDLNLWKQEFDTMASTLPANQNADFACVEGNTQTYFVDLVSFEVWRRNTTAGLISYPSPTPTISPIPPTRVPVPPSNTPVPAGGGGGGGGGGNTGGGGSGGGGTGSGSGSGGSGNSGGCNGDRECGVGSCCAGGKCHPNNSSQCIGANNTPPPGECNPGQKRSCIVPVGCTQGGSQTCGGDKKWGGCECAG